MQKIITNLWYDGKAMEAAEFYTSLFDDGRILSTQTTPESAPGPTGEIMTVTYQMAGQTFVNINGGPQFTLNEAMSLLVQCEDQAEIDRLWEALTDGGQEQPCGWLKDRYGASWQIVPREYFDLERTADPATLDKVFRELLKMTKIDIATLQRAAGS